MAKDKNKTGKSQKDAETPETPTPVVVPEQTDTEETPRASDAVVKVGKAILKNNSQMSVVYMTADGRGFYERNDAENHAKTLTNRVVTPVKR